MLKVTIVFLIAAALLAGCVSTGQSLSDSGGQPAAATTANGPAAATQTADTISADDAKAIALQHAGLTADQVTGLRAELDRDDGRLEWDVDFRSGSYEYDYTIHAQTGKILDVDKDRDD